MVASCCAPSIRLHWVKEEDEKQKIGNSNLTFYILINKNINKICKCTNFLREVPICLII